MVQLNTWAPGWYECSQAFLNSFSNERTRSFYGYQLNRFLSGLSSPELATTQDVSNFISANCADGGRSGGQICKPATRNGRLAVIKSFFAFAQTYRVLDANGRPAPLVAWNPATGFKMLTTSPEPRGLSIPEIERFFKAIAEADVSPLMRARDKALFYFALASCRRVGEIVQLTVGDFSRQVIADEHGAAHEADVYSFVPEKKRSAKRIMLEIAPSVMQALREYWADRPGVINGDLPAFSPLGKPGSEHRYQLWGDPYKPLSCSAVQIRMKTYLKLADLDMSLSPHAWRHSGAQVLLLHDEPLFSIQHVLQHASSRQTERYVSRLHNPVVKSVNRFEAAFSYIAQLRE